jgi:hypothetical protein
MTVSNLARTAACTVLAIACADALAAGGPFGIDHRLAYDNSGIWKRQNQNVLQGAVGVAVVAGALWEGDGDRIGHTWWQSLDAAVIGAASAEVLKRTFSRTRPAESSDPNLWFQGRHHNSFPSGEVAFVTSAVTPFVLEYGPEHPAAYALEVLPLYDAMARVKVRAHWQSDVLASFVLGTAVGYYAHGRGTSIAVDVLPGGFSIGLKTRF